MIPPSVFQTARAFELELRAVLARSRGVERRSSLKTLITGYFGGELATVRRAIDEQVGSVRHSIAPEPLSVRMSQPAPSSESPHNIGVTAAPRPPVNRLSSTGDRGPGRRGFRRRRSVVFATSRPCNQFPA